MLGFIDLGGLVIVLSPGSWMKGFQFQFSIGPI